MSFCENCGAPINENATFCENCGVKAESPGPASVSPPAAPREVPAEEATGHKTGTDEKNPAIALILSLLITGVGQMYNSQLKKGIVLLVVAIIMWLTLWPIGVIVWIFGMYDAYTTAVKINAGQPMPDIFSK